MSYLRPITLEEIEEAPADSLALAILVRLPKEKAFRRYTEIIQVLRDAAPVAPRSGMISYNRDLLHAHAGAAKALAEAWQRLVVDGLIVDWPAYDPQHETASRGDVFQISRWGQQVCRHGDQAGALLKARRRLGVDLHPQLAVRLRDALAVGAFETAVMSALKAVEARVRALAGDPRNPRGDKLVGVALMQNAFAPAAGPLADRDADTGERVGTMNLFAGAFGAVRNVVAHTEIEGATPLRPPNTCCWPICSCDNLIASRLGSEPSQH